MNRIKDALKDNFEDCNTCEKRKDCAIKELKQHIEEKLKDYSPPDKDGFKELNFEAVVGGPDKNLTRSMYSLLEKLETDMEKELELGKFVKVSTKLFNELLFNELSPNKKVEGKHYQHIVDSIAGIEKLLNEIHTIKEAIKHLLPKKEGIKSGQRE